MRRYIYIIMCISVVLAETVRAQVRSGYFIEGYTMAHEMNPALQPGNDYMTFPLIGGIGIGISSSIGMGDILFSKDSRELTTFMSKGTIDKKTLLDKVGSGVSLDANTRINLFGMGRMGYDGTFRTLGISIRTE